MASKLGIFNAALDEIGHRHLVDTGEAVEAGRRLVSQYDRVVRDCLEAGSWNFATETVKLTADTGVAPSFGFTEVFAKPSDWLRTISVSTDEYFTEPLVRYVDDVNFLSAETSPLYFRYVSNDTGMGYELTRWPGNFTRYVELELAYRVCKALTQDSSMKEQIGRDRDIWRKRALNMDAMNEPQPKFAPEGAWTKSRHSHTVTDRGLRNRLTGG